MAKFPPVRDDNGEVIELPPAVRDRAQEQQRREAERQARHTKQVRARAYAVLGRLSKKLVRELQNPEVRAVFLELLHEADGTDYRKGHGKQ